MCIAIHIRKLQCIKHSHVMQFSRFNCTAAAQKCGQIPRSTNAPFVYYKQVAATIDTVDLQEIECKNTITNI